jgi:hypothetical protein
MLSSGQLNSDFALATDVSVATTSSSILSGEKHVGFMVEDEKLGTDKEVEYESTSVSNVRSARKHSTAAAISEFNDQYGVNPIHSLAALSADDGPLVDQNQSNARRHQLLGFNKRKTIWRPICAQGMGILIGWIFLIIPSSNFWLRALVRDQWFSLLAVIAYTEIMDNCMPDSSTTVYILSYIIGFLGPPALELIAWASSLEDNYYMNTFIPTIPCFVAIIAYGYDAFTNQAGIISSDSKLALSDTFNSVNLSSGKKIVCYPAISAPKYSCESWPANFCQQLRYFNESWLVEVHTEVSLSSGQPAAHLRAGTMDSMGLCICLRFDVGYYMGICHELHVGVPKVCWQCAGTGTPVPGIRRL